MKIRLVKWGNSIGIRLPKIFAVQLGIESGTELDVEVRDETVVLRKSSKKLDSLLEAVTPDNLHGEVDISGPVGREVW